jgi:hypothetical protein
LWQYPDSDVANVEIDYLFPGAPGEAARLRAATPESERLLAPTDVKRFVRKDPPETLYNVSGQEAGVFQVEWASTLIADSGNGRIVEVLRPLVDGRYRPDLRRKIAASLFVPFEQTTRAIGPDLGVSRPFSYHQDGQSLKAIPPPAQLVSIQATVSAVPEGELIAAFSAAPGEVREIPGGVWAFSFMAAAQTSAPDTAYLFFKVWICDTNGNKVGAPILQTLPGPPMAAGRERYVITAYSDSTASLEPTQRLCVEIWGLTVGTGTSAITFFYQGDSGSRVAVPVGNLRSKLAFNTVERSADPSGYFSTMLMAASMSNPPDPMRAILGNADPFVGLVNMAVAYDQLGRLLGASIVSRTDGINVFRPRQPEPFQDANGNGRWDPGESFTDTNGNGLYDRFERDLVNVRQADRVRRVDPVTGQSLELALVVDDEGIRLFDGISWNLVDLPSPVLEFKASDYDREMQGMRQLHPDLIYASEGAQRFFPASAQLLAGNRMLIVNSEPSPLVPSPAQAASPGPQKSEIIEVDFSAPPGRRIFRPDGSYFIVPDPFSAAYPALAGFSYSLRQPLWAER